MSTRTRLMRAGWVGLTGGMLYGLGEAWGLLARNVTAPAQTLIGIAAAMGFIVALNGVLGALSLSLIGGLAAQLPGVRRWFEGAQAWTSFCAGLFAALMVGLLGLSQFGVVAGTVRGARAGLFVGVSLVAAATIGVITFGMTRVVLAVQFGKWAVIIRRLIAASWIMAMLLPLAFAFVGRRFR